MNLAGSNLAHRTGKAYVRVIKFYLTFESPKNLENSSTSTLKTLRENIIATLEEARNDILITKQ